MSTSYVLQDWSKKFRVELGEDLAIFPEFDAPSEEIYAYSTVPIYSFSMEGKMVLFPEDPGLKDHDFEPANTLLVDMGEGIYLFISGNYIYSFRALEPIRHYYSPIGNSGVAYPWAVSDNYTYLLIEKAVIPSAIIPAKDPYSFYYCFDSQGEIRIDTFAEMKRKYRTLVPVATFYIFSQSHNPITAYTYSGEKVFFEMAKDSVGDHIIPPSYFKAIDSGELLANPPE